eukprot:COSAG06_NODE_26412_length_615_cov_1.319767_2_plen_48_part_01
MPDARSGAFATAASPLECKALWARGIALGILEAAQVRDGAGDAGDASS